MPKQPHPEDEYFAKQDAIKKQKLAEEKKQNIAKEELEKLKTLHWLRCSGCGLEYETIIFKGNPVHKCFNCGGVFLESGVLEKLSGGESHLLESILEIFRF